METATVSNQEDFKAPALPVHVAPPKKEEPKETSPEKKTEEWAKTTAVDVKVDLEGEDAPPPKMSLAAPTLNYTPPPWACEPEHGLGYNLEVLKSGAIVDSIDLDKRTHSTFIVIGRLPNCDVTLDHPSISRYHCILQYGEDLMTKSGKGWHIYDMGSTHGSKLNKNKLPAKQYVRIHVGFVMQFGGSSRLLTLIGPESDRQPEWDCSPTEMKQKMHRKALDAKLAAAARKEIAEEKEREQAEEGINWGMDYGEDERAAPLFELEGHLTEDGDAYYMADPKKALAKFFEREGFDMEFEYGETGTGHTHKWICSIELPIEIDGVDRAFTAQATVSGSKKDALVQCAIEACRILDKQGVLRKSNTKSRLKKKTLEENDYYDEDDDLYLDRTGQVEMQREKRRKWALAAAGKAVPEKDTYESLTRKLETAQGEMAEIQKKLDELNAVGKKGTVSWDSLDDYCKKLQEVGGVDDIKTKTQKSQLRQRLVALKHESQTLEKLAKIAKPVKMPDLKVNKGGVNLAAGKQDFLRKINMLALRKKGNEGEKKEEKKDEKKEEEKKISENFQPEVEDDEDFDSSKAVGPCLPSTSGESKKEPVDAKSIDNSPATASDLKPANSSDTQPQKSDQKSEDKNRVEEEERKESREREVEKEDEIVTATTSLPSGDVEMQSDSEEKKKGEIVETKEIKAEKRPGSPVDVVEKESEGPAKKKRVRVRNRERKEKGTLDSGDYGVGCETRDEQYATWLPPDTQSGDGKTKLHEKFAGRY